MTGVEANIYPITTMAYIEDDNERISLIVDHASAAASQKQGIVLTQSDRTFTSFYLSEYITVITLEYHTLIFPFSMKVG